MTPPSVSATNADPSASVKVRSSLVTTRLSAAYCVVGVMRRWRRLSIESTAS